MSEAAGPPDADCAIGTLATICMFCPVPVSGCSGGAIWADLSPPPVVQDAAPADAVKVSAARAAARNVTRALMSAPTHVRSQTCGFPVYQSGSATRAGTN